VADIQHKDIVGADAAHPPFYASESDPTNTLGAYRGWIKPSTGEVKIRNAANSAWLDVVVTGTSTALTAHLSDTSDAHDASAISILDTGANFTATDVEAALAELAAGGGVGELDDLSDVDTSTAPPSAGQALIWDDTNSEWVPGSVAAGTVAAADVTYDGGTGMSATDAESALDELATEKANASDLTDHISDTSAAHAASAISYAGGTGMSATQVEAAIDELATEKSNATDLTAHLNDTTDAHDASAISYAGGTGMSATDVEAAIDELATEKTDDSALTAHIGDTTDAHDASAISIADAGGDFTATDVEGALAELFAGGGVGGVADLDDLTDVDVTTTPPNDGEALVFDSGDSLWKPAVVSGGGSGYRTLVTLGSDVSLTSTSLADVTGLSFSVTSGTTYRFAALLVFTSAATTTGLQLSVNGPASPTMLSYYMNWPSSTGTVAFVQWQVAYDASAISTGVPVANTPLIATIEGIIKPSASGTFIVRGATEVAASAITIKAGSTLEYW
jgi:hypothetical protein